MKRNLYLKTTPTAESVKRYMQALHEAGSLTPKTERVNVYDSLGRVTASPVFAKCCSPLFNAAAMDGIAVIVNLENPAEDMTVEQIASIFLGDATRWNEIVK